MPRPLDRRAVLAGLAMTGAAPLFAQIPTNPDVVIVGAGAAGLSAGTELTRRGLTCVIVEAADRVGGRAYTESRSLGQPFDHGCSWINASHVNPMTGLARAAGFTLVDHTSAGSDLFDLDGNRASITDAQDLERAFGAIDRAVSRAGKAGRDVPAADVVPDMPWAAAARSWTGAMDYGVDYEGISTIDYWESSDAQPSFLVREGLGSVVAAQAAGLPVSLDTAVTAIDWSGPGVAVETGRGTIRARACILTVSTGVLNAGRIRFTPALPDRQQQAAADIPMGLLIKIPLLFDGARLGLGENNWLTYQIPEEQPGRACYSVSWPCGLDYVVGFIGGRFGWEIWGDGPDAAIDYALDQMVRLVGSDARKHFLRGLATDWATNPLTLGSYGAVRPGAWGARELLAEPLADRLFYAGEAVAGENAALVHGAWLSGQSTAAKVAKTLG